MVNRQQEFKQAVADILGRPCNEINSAPERVESIKKILIKCPTGKMLLDWADQNNVEIWIDHQIEGGGLMIGEVNTVLISHHSTDEDAAIILAHELHHVYQDSLGLIPLSFNNIQDYVAMAVLSEAGAYAVCGQVVKELENECEIYSRAYLEQQLGIIFADSEWKDESILGCIFKSFISSDHGYQNKLHYLEEVCDALNDTSQKTNSFHSEYLNKGLAFKYNNNAKPAALEYDTKSILPFGQLLNGKNFLIQDLKEYQLVSIVSYLKAFLKPERLSNRIRGDLLNAERCLEQRQTKGLGPAHIKLV